MTDLDPWSTYADDEYRHLVWREAREEAVRLLAAMAGMAPGIAYGWWLTQGWGSGAAASWVITLCGLGSALAGVAGWRLVRRAVSGPRPPRPPARLRRCWVGGEAALVIPPGSAPAGWAAASVGGAAGIAMVVAMRTETVDEVRAGVIIGLALAVALALASPLGWLRGPRLALFADRLEIRNGRNRQAFRWADVVTADGQDRGAVVYASVRDAAGRAGSATLPPAREIRLGDLGELTGQVVDEIRQRRGSRAGPGSGPRSS